MHGESFCKANPGIFVRWAPVMQDTSLGISDWRGKLAPLVDSWGLGKQEGQRKIFGRWVFWVWEAGLVVVRNNVNYDFPFPSLTYNTAEDIFWNHTSPKWGGSEEEVWGRETLTFLQPTQDHMLCPHPLPQAAQPVTQVWSGEVADSSPRKWGELEGREIMWTKGPTVSFTICHSGTDQRAQTLTQKQAAHMAGLQADKSHCKVLMKGFWLPAPSSLWRSALAPVIITSWFYKNKDAQTPAWRFGFHRSRVEPVCSRFWCCQLTVLNTVSYLPAH